MQRLLLLMLVLLMIVPFASAQEGDKTVLPASHKLDVAKLRHEYQGWNNCGPSTLTMALTYFGYSENQNPAAKFLKPHGEDKNVNPVEMVEYVNDVVAVDYGINVKALYRPGGNFDLIKRLLVADFPVIVEKGYEPEGYDWMGHYLFIIGYDDNEQIFYTYDSFLGHGNFQGLKEPYDHMTDYWWDFSNTFIVLYAPEREAEVMEILGQHADMTQAYQIAFAEAQARAQADPADNWSWFNMADALTNLGYFKEGADYFRVAFDLGMPWRTLWYRHTPFEAYYQTGQFKTVITLVQDAKLTTPYVEEFHYYHGLVFASQGREADARAQFGQALYYNSRHQLTLDAVEALDNGTFVPVQQVDN